jgi:hypothetical protein
MMLTTPRNGYGMGRSETYTFELTESRRHPHAAYRTDKIAKN